MAEQQQQAPVTTAGAKPGPLDDNDVNEWKARFNDVLARPGEVVNSRSPEGSQPWYSSLFGCFNPIDLCCMTYCLPCVTFGKTHHRLRKDGNLAGYEPINTSCLMFCGSGCFGLWFIPMAMQRADIREKYHLEGSCLTDIALACCCGLCDLVQQEKEVAYRVQNGGASAAGVQQQYQAPAGGMAYPEQK
ncbi:PLAC8 family domain containing protein [Naviculisporaceae sp. PSN 640]